MHLTLMISIKVGNRQVPQLGQGTWNMGDSASKRAAEIAALRRGVELGLQVIDTAEMYGDGRSETLVGEAVRGMREQVYLVSKVLPSHASAEGTVKACEASLKRLGVEALDLYLLHWRGRFALAETVEGFERLQRGGKIKAWGVILFMRKAHSWYLLFTLRRMMQPELLNAMRKRSCVCCRSCSPWMALQSRRPS